jgi:dUTP pyrophosphatase
MVTIGVKKLRDGIKLPEFSTTHAAGADVFLPDDVELFRHHSYHIPLGFSLDIPEGYEVQVRAKSGLALKHGITLTNGVGTIDADYKGEVGMLLSFFDISYESVDGSQTTNGKYHPGVQGQDVTLKKGSKIVQLVVVPLTPTEYVEVQELTETNSNRIGGFGSTGV